MDYTKKGPQMFATSFSQIPTKKPKYVVFYAHTHV